MICIRLPAVAGVPVIAEAWAALVRAVLCRDGLMQMRADADEAVRRFAAEGIMAPIAAFCQGLARILSGDLDGGDASFQDSVIIATEAEVLEEQARGTLRRAGIEDGYATTLVCAVAARVALRQHLVSAQRTRSLLTYAFPHMAVQSGSSSSASILRLAI